MLSLDLIVALRMTLASPELIRSWSHGEVTRAETIHYRTCQPVKGGLCCERIFGPTRDWQCACPPEAAESRPKSRKTARGTVCPRCQVARVESRVRRERLGHIELSAPVAHPWFARRSPSILGLLLDLSRRELAAVLDDRAYVVCSVSEERRGALLARLRAAKTNESNTLSERLGALRPGSVLDDETFHALSAYAPDAFTAGRGVEGLRACLLALDLDALAAELRQVLGTPSRARSRLVKRLQIVEALRASGLSPAWMILDVIPVLPPDLRPVLRMGNGTLVSSDLNALYTRLLHRNARVRHFLEIGAPEAMLSHEKRLLQAAVDALFDNEHQPRPLRGPGKRPLKSLTATLSGKGGRLRRNLLGKRVDFSARSVIVVNPELRLHQCGLPTVMCLELFKPFLIGKLVERGYAATPHAARRLIERARATDTSLYDLLDEVTSGRLVLLNRAPTLHRLSIQAFEVVRVEGLAIQLHPLVCSAFNADFDGDQMAVFLPLSEEAQAEARALLLSTRNLRSPATGEPTFSLSQDIALGLFYLTQARPSPQAAGRLFAGAAEAIQALETGVIDLHTAITVRLGEGVKRVYNAPGRAEDVPPRKRLATTAGRLLFNQALPTALGFKNYEMSKERLKLLVAECLRACSEEETALLSDALMRLGFHYATRSGISFAMSDIQVPDEKWVIQARAEAQEREVKEHYRAGMISAQECNRQVIALWTKATEEISASLEAHLDPWGSLATIIKSGATKARFQQIRQLGGIRGLMVRPSGEIIPIPITTNYLTGQTVADTFIAASGARKGFGNRSRDTRTTGYLTRRLVEAAMDIWINRLDCGTTDGLLIGQQESRALGLPDMRARLLSRVLAEDLPSVGLSRGAELREAEVEAILAAGIPVVRVRSPLTCRAPRGLCARCYGLDLATARLVRVGIAVGILAGESIGEPGTQLTMRTFHSGGIAGAQGDITRGLPRVEELLDGRRPARRATLSATSGTVRLCLDAHTGERLVHVLSREAGLEEERLYRFPADTPLVVSEGEAIAAGAPLTTGSLDPSDVLELLGREAAARSLVGEVQRVYRTAGAYLHDKHLEVLVTALLRFVVVADTGDTRLLPGTMIAQEELAEENLRVLAQGGSPALGHPVLCGLETVGLAASSVLSAASFQETSRVLARAAIDGKVDRLTSYKARIVLGKSIPRLIAHPPRRKAPPTPPRTGDSPVSLPPCPA